MPSLIHSRSSGACRWAFTLNNPTEDECADLAFTLVQPRIKYAIVGRETGESGTPHLQGFFITFTPLRETVARKIPGLRAHTEKAKASSAANRTYCAKDGDFDEYGTIPSEQGKRTDIDGFREWVVALDHAPSQREIAEEFPALFLRYPRLTELAGHLRPLPDLNRGACVPREWQLELESSLSVLADDRTVLFYVDPDGGKGKSWFVRYYVSKFPATTQFLSVGKRDDLAYAIDETKTVFLFDLPRLAMEHFQYSVLEKLKDQLVFSSKYASRVKILPAPVHVVVFTNEEPDRAAMTEDRYRVTYL
jgi:hypothetical protein